MARFSATISASHRVATDEELDALYGAPLGRSLVKELDHISEHYRTFIEKSPFVIIASSGPEGLDCSPRGDPPGFVRVADENTVLIPDRRGNNRIDTLRNIVRDPRVSLLFLIPGVGETLRLNGRAEFVAEPALLASFAMNGKKPRSVLVVTAEQVYYQCQKALARARLWSQDAQISRSILPTAGDMLQALDSGFDGEAYDHAYPQHMKNTIY